MKTKMAPGWELRDLQGDGRKKIRKIRKRVARQQKKQERRRFERDEKRTEA